MPKRKVRFTVKAGDEVFQLFQVLEDAKGQLVISNNRASVTDHRHAGRMATKLDKITVHISAEHPASYGVSQELHYENGDKIKHTTMVDFSDSFCWPIRISFSANHLFGPRPAISGGEQRALNEYNPFKETLLSAVFVTDKTKPFCTGENPNLYVIAEFRWFRLIIYTIKIPVPSPMSSSSVGLFVGRERWNDEEIHHQQHRAVSIPFHFVPLIRNWGVWQLREKLLGFIRQVHGEEVFLRDREYTEIFNNIGYYNKEKDGDADFLDFLEAVLESGSPELSTTQTLRGAKIVEMSDLELRRAYLQTDGEPGNVEADALAAEISRREIDI